MKHAKVACGNCGHPIRVPQKCYENNEPYICPGCGIYIVAPIDSPLNTGGSIYSGPGPVGGGWA